MNLESFDKRSYEQEKQEELLRSFVSIEQYDKLLYYLEATLFKNTDRIYCPSAFIIDVLFTLGTLGQYNNAQLLKKEFGSSLSSRPVNVRATNILQGIVDLVKKKYKKGTHNNYLFNEMEYNENDINFAEKQLVKSLAFIKKDKPRLLRPRTSKKKYKEIPPTDQNVNSPSPSKTHENADEWSPQKKLFENQIQRLDKPATFQYKSDSESDNEYDFLDKKSYMILKHQRFDVALDNERIWAAIGWALKCSSNINDLVKREAWKVWKPIISIILDILAIDLESFEKVRTKSNGSDHDPAPFESTLIYKFFHRAGKYLWARKIADSLFTDCNSDFTEIYNNELTISKSVILVKSIEIGNGDGELNISVFSSDSIDLRHKLFLLASRVTVFEENSSLSSSTKHSVWSFQSLLEQICLKLYDGSYSDFRAFMSFTNFSSFDKPWKLQNIVELILQVLAQISSFEIDYPENTLWIYDTDYQFMKSLIRGVYVELKYYESPEGLRRKKLADDLSKLHLDLFQLFRIWLFASDFIEETEDLREFQQMLIEDVKFGEVKRLSLVKGCKINSEEDGTKVVSLTDLMYGI